MHLDPNSSSLPLLFASLARTDSLQSLGYGLSRRSETILEEHEKDVISYEHPRIGFAVTLPLSVFANEIMNRRKPGALNYLAFRAASGATIVRGLRCESSMLDG